MCLCETVPLFYLFPASEATYNSRNEERAELYHQAASHRKHNTQKDLLMQAVNTASFIRGLVYTAVQPAVPGQHALYTTN